MLSLFDGIGTAILALVTLGYSIYKCFTWEIDEDCNRLTRHHFPQAEQRGNFLEEDPRNIADWILQQDPDRVAPY